jgi:nucleoside-diphosphate-sugar epimerase
MKETYLITGATGFVGSNLTRTLIKKHKNVHIFVRKLPFINRLSDCINNLHIHQCDLVNDNLNEIVKSINPTYVFHLASFGTMPGEKDIQRMIDVNLVGTVRLIKALENCSIKLFVHTGSSSEYGIRDKSMIESESLTPVNDYGITKAAASLYVYMQAKEHKFPAVIFRLFSPFGYYEHPSRFIPYVIVKAVQNLPIKLSSPGYVRDYIFIEDVISAYLKVCDSSIEEEIFNIGSGHQKSLQNVVKNIIKITGSKSIVIWNSVKKQERQSEPKFWQADISKAKSIFGWSPKYSFEEGLEMDIKWFRKNLNLYT